MDGHYLDKFEHGPFNYLNWGEGAVMSKVLLILFFVPVVAIAKAPIAPYAFGSALEPGDPPSVLIKVKEAANLAAQNPNCAKVIDAFHFGPNDRDPEHPNALYFVKCMAKYGGPLGKDSAYGVWFTGADLKAKRIKGKERPISKDRALLLCRQSIKEHLRYPDSADFSALTAYVSDNGTVNREVVLKFTALNGFGNRVPQRGKCIITPRSHVYVSISNR